MDTEQAPVPVQSPDQPAKEEPIPGSALNETGVPQEKLAEHVPGQLMPPGVLDTEPVPLPVLVTASIELPGAVSVALIVAADDEIEVTATPLAVPE